MAEFLTRNETALKLGIFGGVMVLMMIFEALWPRKKRTQPRGTRWVTNLGIIVIDSLFIRLLFPIVAMGVAAYAAGKGYGLLNLISLPVWGHIVFSMIVLDMAIYWQHVAAHKIPMIWMFHKMHHADRDLDATSGTRFHPVEIAASMLYKMAIALILGPHVIGVLMFEIVLNVSAIFNHANVKLPLWLDRIVRTVFVTPDMHRVHHSIIGKEFTTNYGFNMSIWDKIFGTYTDQPSKGHDGMTLGLKEYQSDNPSHLIWCLLLPFKKK
ncbi:MAG: sterol desaturase family protein [Robiginitomaculum sp.]